MAAHLIKEKEIMAILHKTKTVKRRSAFYFDVELIDRLQVIAKENELSFNEVCRQLLERSLEEIEMERIAS